MITLMDIQNWLKTMPDERTACQNMADMQNNILYTYSRDALDYRGHTASNKLIYRRTESGIEHLSEITEELAAVLAILEDRDDLPLRISAGVLRKELLEARKEARKKQMELLQQEAAAAL